ncbi:MAG: DUF1573 domain-containing protein [Prevotella sp.]|jgi:hypothetical protein|nr:DUF1573 domain-containing protein [Prevotella sp.]
MKKKLLYSCIIFLLGCSKIDSGLLQNQSFESICSLAYTNNSPFCIVLIDSTQYLSKEYFLHLQGEYKGLTNKAIYNIIDINSDENNWYLKWLCPISIPLTCVFSPDGVLIDLIPGVSKESFLYSEEAIKNMETTEFHWPNRFKMNKKKIIPLFNDILELKRDLDIGTDISSESNLLIDSLRYPYPVYLKLVGELMKQDTIGAQQTAKSLIELETPSSLELYKNEFITAKKILDPRFDIESEPNIRVDKTTISFKDCRINEKTPFNITIYNDGERPLKIEKIHLSCSCLEHLESNKSITIDPKCGYVTKFHFIPDHGGEILRNIYITSNAINTPILHIDISANVAGN